MKMILTMALSLVSMIYPMRVSAASEFSTSFTTEYTISQLSETNVTHTIALKNNLAHIYATDYTLATSGDKLENITASDETGPIATTTTIQNGITTIHLQIERPSIGKDQVKTLVLNYQTNDVVEKIGNTTTINIPRLAKANESENYTRIVKVEGVGELPQFIYPPQNKTEADELYSIYTFNGHQNESLTLLFGESVTYKLDLTYELKNKELKSTDSELALPPDTGYQKVFLSKIDPQPIHITTDSSGNWLARYNLAPQEKKIVSAELFITVYPIPTSYDPSATTMHKTAHSKYWGTNSASVENLAERLKTPSSIYDYLVSNFTYNYVGASGGANRMGAIVALSSPSNVLCTEFTDSFVALSRHNNIPSREINGYGFTKNNLLQPQNLTTDILHAWPEYYDSDKKLWIAVDPTWGNTTGGIDYFNKLDFSHITFVRHGDEDSYPLPVGAYKSNPSDKHIEINVASNEIEAVEKYEMLDEEGTLYLLNTGNVALVEKEIEIDGGSFTIDYLPPYGKTEIPKNQKLSFYDKIKAICVNLLSKFWRPQPASM